MAWPFKPRSAQSRDALTGSVAVVPHDGARITQRRSKDADWQKEAWGMFKALGEVRFCARYIGNSLARVRFFVGTRDHPGDPITAIPDDPKGPNKVNDLKVRDILERIKGKDGTFSSLVRTYGVHRFVAGESYLVGVEGLDGETWEFLSTSELRRMQRNAGAGMAALGDDMPQYERDKNGDGTYVQIDGQSLVLRFWSRDPEYRERADSAMRPVLDICEALITAGMMQTAGDRSRVALNGLFLVPAEAELPKAPVVDNPGHPAQQPRLALLDSMLEAMTVSMENPGSVGALSPILTEVKSEFIDKFQLIRFDREIDKTIVARIDHLIRRFAQGVDLPPEILLGMGDSNHWSAWAISEEAIGAHITPAAAEFCEDLTVGYLVPTLKEMGGLDDLDRYGIGFDVTDLVVSPDRAQHAITLYDKWEMGADHLLEALGFDPSVRPDMDEIIRRILITRASNPRNPDPGPDFDALLGKAPPPSGAERPVPGQPNVAINPDTAEPVVEGQDAVKAVPHPPEAPQPVPTKNGAQQPAEQQQPKGAAAKKPPPQQTKQQQSEKVAQDKKAPPTKKKGKAQAAAGVIGDMARAIDMAVDAAVSQPEHIIRDTARWNGLRTELSRLGLIDAEVLDRVIDGAIILARGEREHPASTDVLATATVLVEAAFFDDEDLLDSDVLPV